MGDARIVRHDEADTGLVIESADDLGRPALEHLDNRAFRASAMIDAAHAHDDTIAMHYFAHLAIGQQYRCRAIFRVHESVPVAMPCDRADDQSQAFAQAIFIASIADDVAAMQRCFELRLQSCPLRRAGRA